MKKILRWVLGKPITWLVGIISSSPNQKAVFHSLGRLLRRIGAGKKNKGLIKPFDIKLDKIIIFSDQHKGARDKVDDFKDAEKTYLTALEYYHDNEFQFISLGDCEELWKNKPEKVMAKNDTCFDREKKFEEKDQYYRIFGNHDLEWKFKKQQADFLQPVFGKELKVYEGLLLKTDFNSEHYFIFIAHGHQGDLRSDGNTFSVWVVANIWTPVQRYLGIKVNTPATSFALVDKHNIMMHDWSSTQKNLIFISGHTHKPVFASLDHIDRLTKELHEAQKANNQSAIESIQKELEERKKKEYAGKQQVRTNVKPCYFNSGCCCYDDGNITGIEIADGNIRLIKWYEENGKSIREVLEQSELSYIFEKLNEPPKPSKNI